jgi:hypothetical protein
VRLSVRRGEEAKAEATKNLKVLKMRRYALRTLWLLLALTASASNGKPVKVIATLVEAHSSARCHGLDCPPWPMPPDTDFCFQAGDKYYTAISHPWSVPWAANGKKLMALQGQSVEISIADKEIVVTTTSSTTVHLKRVHDDLIFNLESCKHN